MLCPDIYLTNFNELAARFARSGNTLFIPECAGDIHGAANAFYAIGQYKAIGYSMMGVGELQRMTAFRAGDAGSQIPADVEGLPLPQAYAMLTQLAPLVLEHQTKGTIAGVWLNNKGNSETTVKLGGYLLHVSLRVGAVRRQRPRRAGEGRAGRAAVPDVAGYGMFLATGPDEFLMTGDNAQVIFIGRMVCRNSFIVTIEDTSGKAPGSGCFPFQTIRTLFSAGFLFLRVYDLPPLVSCPN